MLFYLFVFFFFFSSRRRHTRCLSDWSSDVCSSDLAGPRIRIAADEVDVVTLEIGRRKHRGLYRRSVEVDHVPTQDRKSTRLNSSHLGISYAVFCLKKKNIK